MEDHKQYSFISSFSQKYPKSAGALFATFNDLHLVQNWGTLNRYWCREYSRSMFYERSSLYSLGKECFQRSWKSPRAASLRPFVIPVGIYNDMN
ncbi:hypothetical protein PNOK_0713100 [Pyrrhoderma noxium]|uniref:Uncharacterized protein n=1 Tax=Pyrrhoderma noxium TaxID=2282107 RepID=A0A286UBY2_9AGAM|nr:hypothetical protein PNOK_0713100 [Pyrrhoderma noxium]